MKHPIQFIRGLSLIELMVSLAIGLVLLAAAGYAFLGSRAAFRQQEALARMQEPDAQIRRYKAPESLLAFLKAL